MPQPRAARSTRGKPASRLGDESEKENETADAPKQRESRKTKQPGVPRKSRQVVPKMAPFYTDFYAGSTDETWHAMTVAQQLNATKEIADFLEDKGKLPMPRKGWLDAAIEGHSEFGWRAKTDEEQVAIILERTAGRRQRKKAKREEKAATDKRLAQEAAAEAAAAAAAAAAAGAEAGAEVAGTGADDGGGGGGGGVEDGGGAEGGALQPAKAVAIRRGHVNSSVLHLFKRTAEINAALAKLQVPGGPLRQLMLVEVDDQAPANTGGGRNAAANRVRDKRLLRVVAANTSAPKFLGELLRNGFSDQPAKQAFANCEVQKLFNCADVNNMTRTEIAKRTRDPYTNHAQTMAAIIVTNNLPMSAQGSTPADDR